MRSSHLIALACCVAAVSLPVQSQGTVTPPACTCDTEAIAKLTARVLELESAVAVLQAAQLTIPSEPEPEPEVEPNPVVEVTVSFADWILEEYTGNEWYSNGQPVTAAHLATHGIAASELEGRSTRELGLLHGAIHTTGIEALRRSYSGEDVAPVTTGYWKKTCRKGRCIRQWIPHNQ